MIYFLQNVIKIFITFYLSEISESIMLIRRKDYMDRLYEGKDDNDVIKVITGCAVADNPLFWKCIWMFTEYPAIRPEVHAVR